LKIKDLALCSALQLLSRCFLTQLILQPWRWRLYYSPKRRWLPTDSRRYMPEYNSLHGNGISGFYRTLGNSWVVEQLKASQEGLSSIELVIICRIWTSSLKCFSVLGNYWES
jgi:hypothetical protein